MMRHLRKLKGRLTEAADNFNINHEWVLPIALSVLTGVAYGIAIYFLSGK